ncbi:hypothetical protein R3X25_02065 [Lutibacter sp. TH_r2]|uniref:hypothetical protein n=1 Tax=Lutibacter sp. TH_r2 TaxID=3082083 RepID=UPI002953180F|nr:hypothetical protein [Lutibacter sp. TH_r2]MDV7186053.1 hypothetical protein [Lutibacter sp. TH_r2]
MKTLKYILSTLILLITFWSCTEEELGSTDFTTTVVAPTGVTAVLNVTQDNTGLVTIAPNSEGGVSYTLDLGDGSEMVTLNQGESVTNIYAEGEYTVSVTAVGITGLTTIVSVPLTVSFKAPENLLVEITNDEAISRQVNVLANADYAITFDVYFGEDGVAEPVSGNIGDIVSYIYNEPGMYTIRVVAKSAAIETTEYSVEFEVTEILEPLEKAPTPPTREAEDVVSIFSDAYTNINVNEWNPGWGQSTTLTDFDVDGDNILKYDYLNYTGIVTDYDNPTDLSQMEFVHFDYWTNDAESLSLKIVNTSQADGTPEKESEISVDGITEGEWVSVDIPLTDFTTDMSGVTQFLFGSSGVTVFIDNFYFYKVPTVFADLPITFDSTVETFETFLGAEFEITADPDDANNPVGKITNYGADNSWGWEGVKLQLDTWVDMSIIPTIKLDFYNDGATHDVLMKLEDTTSPLDGNGNPTVFEEVHATVSNTGWSTLIFEFTSGLSYDSLVLFVDGGSTGIPGTYYFDNVVNEEYISLPLTMDTPGQTFETFLGAEFEITADPDDANNSVGKITNYGADTSWGWEGIKLNLDEWINTDADYNIKLDFYNDGAAHDILIKLEDSTSPLDGNGNPSVIEEVHASVSNTGWSELTFNFTSGLSFDNIVIFVDGGETGIPGTFYFDNVMHLPN